jgi:imidazolonepropionase-like amidohydrolase
VTEHVNLVIRANMLIDGLGGTQVSQGLVAIAGYKIVYVGTASHAPMFPPDAQVLDLPDACLMPGLMDMHSHPTFYWEEPDLATYTDDIEGVTSYPPAMITLLAVSNLHKALMFGVTILRDTGSVDDIMFNIRRGVKKGPVPSPRLYISGRLIIPIGGHCRNLMGLTSSRWSPWFSSRRA